MRYLYRPIFAMAHSRKDVLARLSNLSDELSEHIIKCMVYGDQYNSYNHWITEISNFLTEASRLESKSGKLSYNDYDRTLFKSFGTTMSDAKSNLNQFRRDYCYKSSKYTKFIVSDDMIDVLYYIYCEFKKFFIPAFQAKSISTSGRIRVNVDNILSEVIDID